MPISPEESIELYNSASREFRQMVERSKNRLTRHNLRLSERYIQGELKVIVLLSLIGGEGQSNDLLALHYCERCLIEPQGDATGTILDSPTLGPKLNGNEQSVLVRDIELVEVPEGKVSTVTRLYVADEFLRTNAHSLYFSAGEGGIIRLGRIADRKLCVPCGLFAVSQNQLPGQMIESASEIVDGISDKKRNRIREFFKGLNEQDDVLDFGYRVMLDANRVGLSFPESKLVHSKFKVNDVLVGPSEF